LRSEINRLSGAIEKFKENITENEESDSQLLSSLMYQDLYNLPVYILCKLLNKLHHRLWASSVIQIPRGKTTAIMLALSKIVRIMRLGPYAFQQLGDIF